MWELALYLSKMIFIYVESMICRSLAVNTAFWLWRPFVAITMPQGSGGQDKEEGENIIVGNFMLFEDFFYY